MLALFRAFIRSVKERFLKLDQSSNISPSALLPGGGNGLKQAGK